MMISLRKQVDGRVNVYASRENTSVSIPGQFASEITAFKWMLCQQSVRLVNGDLDWRKEISDNISGDYDVSVWPK